MIGLVIVVIVFAILAWIGLAGVFSKLGRNASKFAEKFNEEEPIQSSDETADD